MQPQDPVASHAAPDATSRRLHRAAPADAAAVRELTRAAYAKWVPVIGREPRPMTADHDAAVRDHLVDLLDADGELVGLIEMVPAPDHLLIVNVAVAPAAQGRGHSRALMAHAEAVARSLGLDEVRLYTNGRFAENVRLYRRLGYRVDREEVHPQLGVAVYMSKRLAPDAAGPLSSVFLPEGDGANPEEMVRAAVATADAFTECFNARDLAGMDARLHFPHVILSGERLIVWDGPGQMPQGFFDDLTRTTGWDRTITTGRQAVLVSTRKVHLLMDYTRNRADGSVITRHRNLWVVTHDGGRWGIKQRSY
jgi:ribosomal protein S18 acetylase RimI-like enzyme